MCAKYFLLSVYLCCDKLNLHMCQKCDFRRKKNVFFNILFNFNEINLTRCDVSVQRAPNILLKLLKCSDHVALLCSAFFSLKQYSVSRTHSLFSLFVSQWRLRSSLSKPHHHPSPNP